MDENTLAKLVREAVKEELNVFKQETATKEDLKAFATKEDIEKLRSEMATKENLKAFATKEDFLEMESRLSSALQNVREGVRLSLIEVEHELREIKSKLRFYDFDYLARQNDALAKVLKDLYEEKTLIATKLKEHESRIGTVEAKL